MNLQVHVFYSVGVFSHCAFFMYSYIKVGAIFLSNCAGGIVTPIPTRLMPALEHYQNPTLMPHTFNDRLKTELL